MSEGVLYHFTCVDHGLPGITRSGVVIPNHHPLIVANVAWFTSEAEPDRERTGLGMNITRCDRMAYRFTVDKSSCRPWLDSWERRSLRSRDLRAMESFGDPEQSTQNDAMAIRCRRIEWRYLDPPET